MKLSGSATGLDDTREEIHESGYRRFVGGAGDYWELIGQLQFRFLVDHGLAPSETFVDVGCGALRGGVKLIRYLAPDRYLGIDKHIELIIYGVANELGIDQYREKRPRFVVSEGFEFHRFDAKPAFGIAQSLFTHLAADDVAAPASLAERTHRSRLRRNAAWVVTGIAWAAEVTNVPWPGRLTTRPSRSSSR